MIGTAILNGFNPEAYLSHVLGRIAKRAIDKCEELLPLNVAAPVQRREASEYPSRRG